MGKEKGLPSGSSELRSIAEERLRSEKIVNGFSQSYEESQRLIHELQVHQIELEMHNEELQRAQEAAADASTFCLQILSVGKMVT